MTAGLAVTVLGAAPAQAASVRGYVPETDANYDYTYFADLPPGVKLAVDRGRGALTFRRGAGTVVRARMCGEDSENDPVRAVREEAKEVGRRAVGVRRGVYRVGREYWITVRGGTCLRLSRRLGRGASALTRSLALRTRARLGRAATVPPSDPAGRALARRVDQTSAAVDRATMAGTGGICDGAGLACRRVLLRGEVTVSAGFDFPARYGHFRIKLPALDPFWGVVRGKSTWYRLGDRGCWLGPDRDSGVDDAFTLHDLASPRGYQVRIGRPRALSGGRIALSWRGYWDRGTAVVDASGMPLEVRVVERWDPGLTLSIRYTFGYPGSADQIGTDPNC